MFENWNSSIQCRQAIIVWVDPGDPSGILHIEITCSLNLYHDSSTIVIYGIDDLKAIQHIGQFVIQSTQKLKPIQALSSEPVQNKVQCWIWQISTELSTLSDTHTRTWSARWCTSAITFDTKTETVRSSSTATQLKGTLGCSPFGFYGS